MSLHCFIQGETCGPEHFVLEGVRIEGISATGRAPVQVLTLNDARRSELRQELLKQGGLS